MLYLHGLPVPVLIARGGLIYLFISDADECRWCDGVGRGLRGAGMSPRDVPECPTSVCGCFVDRLRADPGLQWGGVSLCFLSLFFFFSFFIGNPSSDLILAVPVLAWRPPVYHSTASLDPSAAFCISRGVRAAAGGWGGALSMMRPASTFYFQCCVSLSTTISSATIYNAKHAIIRTLSVGSTPCTSTPGGRPPSTSGRPAPAAARLRPTGQCTR